MKGIVFAEFLEMMEARFGPAATDHVLETSSLQNGGAYTSVGTYDHQELVRMVRQLSAHTGIEAGSLVKAFGEYLVERFAAIYPRFFEGMETSFQFLPMVESHIHVEVKKLYPDAGLPQLTCTREGADRMVLEYRSQRPFADLAEGMIAGTGKHFGERLQIDREELSEEGAYATRFVLTKLG